MSAVDAFDKHRLHLKGWATPALLFAVALSLRLLSPGIDPAGDEAITRRFVHQYDAFALLWRIPLYQPHFPLYYLLLDAVEALTGSARHGAALSYLAGAAVPVVAYRWFVTVVRPWRAFYAAGLLAVSPLLVVQSHWLRMYALLALAVCCSWWAAWRWLDGAGRLRTVVGAGLVVAALHPFGLFVAVAQLGWLTTEQYVGEWRDGFWKGALVLSTAVGVGLAVLAARIVLETGVGAVNPDSLHVSAAYNPALRLALLPLTTLTGTLHVPVVLWAAVGLTGWLGVRYVRAHAWRTREGRMLACWIGGSLVLLAIAQAVRPVLMLKYVGWLAPAAAFIVARYTPNDRRLHVTLGILLGIVATNLLFAVFANGNVSMTAYWDSGVLRELR